MSGYEMQRLARIAENTKQLELLGIKQVSVSLRRFEMPQPCTQAAHTLFGAPRRRTALHPKKRRVKKTETVGERKSARQAGVKPVGEQHCGRVGVPFCCILVTSHHFTHDVILCCHRPIMILVLNLL